jgi:phosphoglycerol transferase MdoB-like AlkP superfamily enzyme
VIPEPIRILFEEFILPDQIDEDLYIQHKKQTEKTLKKIVIFCAALFLLIVISAFFV